MFMMYREKQWWRLARNLSLAALLVLLAVALASCSTTLTKVEEAPGNFPPPELLVRPKEPKAMTGKASLSKHLQEQAKREKRAGDDRDRQRDLQDWARRSSNPTPKK